MRRLTSLCILVAFGAFPASPLPAAERQATPPSSITVREGFRVELLRSAQEGEGSWISMTFDDCGRLIVGIDQSGLGRLTITGDPPGAEFERLENTQTLLHSRGVLYFRDALYVCATNSKGFYRLRDTSGDGQFDEIELLKEMDYRSRYGHGTNQVVPGPDGMLYVVNGNDVSFPEGSDPDSPYRDPQNDWLLPNPHDAGQDHRVGHILRVDPEGKEWTVIAGGLRNPFDVAFNEHGELFTWDADMEWDAGLPWYRPTRMNHLVAGGEYGWRWGTGKWPDWFPDSLPTTLDTGYGSPTGMIFGTESGWPERYRKALFMADWQNGRILIADLVPRGASYSATTELFLEGGPLNVCDLVFGPDGSLYFITGGRGSQSGLYRVTYAGSSAEETEGGRQPDDLDRSSSFESRRIRHRLEEFHTRQDPGSVDFIWKHLRSEDVWLRFAARVALENQPLELWRERLASSPESLARRTALLALARVGERADQPMILERLAEVDVHSLTSEELLLPLRTMQLTFIRQGPPEAADRQAALEQIDPLFPHESFPANWLLGELLVFLNAPQTPERLLDLLEEAATQEEQVRYAGTLTRISSGWTLESRKRMLEWLYRSRGLPGGKLVDATLRNLRTDVEESLSEAEREQLTAELARLDEPLEDEDASWLPSRPLVRRWTMEDLLEDVVAVRPEEHSIQRGRAALAAAACLRCHRVGDRGGQVGPDLTNVGKRFDARALLESILDPSREVDPKYLHTIYLLRDGRIVTGRPVGVNRSRLLIETDPLTGASVAVPREEIDASRPSGTSPMPQGLLDTLTREEILDLIALLRRDLR